MAAIATIVSGAALICGGGLVAAGFQETRNETEAGQTAFGGGMAGGFLGGVAGIVLGVLTLIGIAPMVLLSVSAIVFGATLFMGTGGPARMRTLAMPGSSMHPMMRNLAVAGFSRAHRTPSHDSGFRSRPGA